MKAFPTIPAAPPHHSTDWLVEFELGLRQQRFFDRLLRYAKQRTKIVERARGFAMPGYANDLVLDAIEDTYIGTVTWVPGTVTLVHHVRRVIRSRSHHDYLRAKRFHHVALDPDDACFRDPTDRQHAVLRWKADATLAALRELAANDPHVLRLLDAYEQVVLRRSAVLEFTKLTPHEYEAAKNRLARLRDRLPISLHPNH